MKRYLYAVLASIAMIGCSEEMPIDQQAGLDKKMPVFEAFTDETNNKAQLAENLKINWIKGDRISVFAKSTANSEYLLSEGADCNRGKFESVIDGELPGTILKLNGAVYPYDGANAVMSHGSNGLEFTFSLPDEQFYAVDSFDPDAFPMLAVSTDTNLEFKNVCGVLLLQLTGKRKLTRIEIKGNDNESIAGKGKAAMSLNGLPTWHAASDIKNISMDCSVDGGVLLSDKATSFFITLPPVEFSKGFKVTLFDSEGRKKTVSKSQAQTIVRNQILKMPVVNCAFSQSVLKPGKDIKWNLPDRARVMFRSGQKEMDPSLADDIISVDGSESRSYVVCEGTECVVSTAADEFVWNRDCSDMFAFNKQLREISFDGCNTSQVVDMGGMLKGCSNLVFADLSSFDTGKVTKANGLAGMFEQMGSSTDEGTELVLGPDFMISSPEIAKNMFVDAKIGSIRCTPEMKLFIEKYAESLEFDPYAAGDGTVWYNFYTGEVMETQRELVIVHDLTYFLIPMLEGETDGAKIKWGDGKEEVYRKNATHNYDVNGDHNVVIQTKGVKKVSFESLQGIKKISFSKF